MSAGISKHTNIACIWDFDKTLIPGYMQAPLFRRYGVNEAGFWMEVNQLEEVYKARGYRVSGESLYLNHLLSYVRCGPMAGLNNAILRECGREILFYEGLPEFFNTLRKIPESRPEFRKHELRLEHYIVSTGLAEMIRGSAIAPFVDGIWGCEFIENPLPAGYLQQPEFDITTAMEIRQIGMMIDNTTKTRALFEINKGSNRDPAIDVNANIEEEDRRIPFSHMFYIADGPSDVPSFSVVKGRGGTTYAVYRQGSAEEFAQNDRLLDSGRIHFFGPARYVPESTTSLWLTTRITQLCERIVREREDLLARRIRKPPRHLSDPPSSGEPDPVQGSLFDEDGDL